MAASMLQPRPCVERDMRAELEAWRAAKRAGAETCVPKTSSGTPAQRTFQRFSTPPRGRGRNSENVAPVVQQVPTVAYRGCSSGTVEQAARVKPQKAAAESTSAQVIGEVQPLQERTACVESSRDPLREMPLVPRHALQPVKSQAQNANVNKGQAASASTADSCLDPPLPKKSTLGCTMQSSAQDERAFAYTGNKVHREAMQNLATALVDQYDETGPLPKAPPSSPQRADMQKLELEVRQAELRAAIGCLRLEADDELVFVPPSAGAAAEPLSPLSLESPCSEASIASKPRVDVEPLPLDIQA